MKFRPFEPFIDYFPAFEPRLTTLRARGSGFLTALRNGAKNGSRQSRTRPYARTATQPAFSQRVVVKARVVIRSGNSALRTHRGNLSYLYRLGAGQDGGYPEFFNDKENLTRKDLSQHVTEWKNDAHHFRFILSPEKGEKLDLKDFTRNVMKTVSTELKTDLEWFAVCHYDTDNPHAHIVMRGVDQRGETLFLKRDFISHRIRHIAEREATLRLGVRNKNDFESSLEASLLQTKFTSLDRELKKLQADSKSHSITLKPPLATSREWERRTYLNRIKRLNFLASNGLAEKTENGKWILHSEFETTLRQLQRREELSKLISPQLRNSNAKTQVLEIHSERIELSSQIHGQVLIRGVWDELNDKKFLLVSGDDGRNHFVPLGRFSEARGFEPKAGAIVTVTRNASSSMRALNVICKRAQTNGGVFHLTQFRESLAQSLTDKSWSLPEGLTLDEYLERFVRTADSLSRSKILTKQSNISWKVPRDAEVTGSALRKLTDKNFRISVKVDSHLTLHESALRSGASWLDRLNESEKWKSSKGHYRTELLNAMEERRKTLSQRGIHFDSETFKTLSKIEMQQFLERTVQRFGPKIRLSVGDSIAGKVAAYEGLGDGFRMIVLAPSGSLFRKVQFGEERYPIGTAVEVKSSLRNVRGKSVPILIARPLTEAISREKTLRRK